jgi:hypothetical protein
MELVKVSLQLEPSIAQALDVYQKQRFIRSRSSAVNQLLAQALNLATAPSSPPTPVTPVPAPVAPAPAPASDVFSKWGSVG